MAATPIPMELEPRAALELLLRWAHVAAGVAWLGLLWLQVRWAGRALGLEGPEARAWARASSLVSLVSGVFLLFLLYYAGAYLTADGRAPRLDQWLVPLGVLLGAYPVHALLAGRVRGWPLAGIWLVGSLGFAQLCHVGLGLSGRAAVLHVGALQGVILAGSTWLRPGGEGEDAVRRREREGGVLSLSTIVLMLSVHLPSWTGLEPLWGWLAGVQLLGLAGSRLLSRQRAAAGDS